MKILHVIPSLRMAGAERLMVDLLPEIKQRGEHEVELLLFDGYQTPFYEEIEKTGVTVHCLSKSSSVSSNRTIYSPLNLFRLFKYLKKYDIIHTHLTICQFYAAVDSLFVRCNLVTSEHDASNRRRHWKWYKMIDKWMYGRYKAVICVAKQTEINLREYLGETKVPITTILNGVDLKRFVNAKSSTELEKLAPQTKKVIQVARFTDQKDQQTLIRAFCHLDKNYHLFLVGDGPNRYECEQLVKENNLEEQITFLGLRTDIPQLLQASDIIVLSSHYEGLSISSIEGMSCGKPFIASDVDGLREMVEGAGVLFKEGDDKELAVKIAELCQQPEKYQQIAKQCEIKARDYSIEKMADAYLEVYKKIVK